MTLVFVHGVQRDILKGNGGWMPVQYVPQIHILIQIIQIAFNVQKNKNLHQVATCVLVIQVMRTLARTVMIALMDTIK